MSTVNYQATSQEIDSAIEMIGETHMLCIIHHLAEKEMRFNELQRAISGMNPTTLTDRLKKLEKNNVVERKEETLDKVSVVYALTDKGRALVPVIGEISKFAQKYS